VVAAPEKPRAAAAAAAVVAASLLVAEVVAPWAVAGAAADGTGVCNGRVSLAGASEVEADAAAAATDAAAGAAVNN